MNSPNKNTKHSAPRVAGADTKSPRYQFVEFLVSIKPGEYVSLRKFIAALRRVPSELDKRTSGWTVRAQKLDGSTYGHLFIASTREIDPDVVLRNKSGRF